MVGDAHPTLTIIFQVFESMNTLRLMRAVQGCTSVAERMDARE